MKNRTKIFLGIAAANAGFFSLCAAMAHSMFCDAMKRGRTSKLLGEVSQTKASHWLRERGKAWAQNHKEICSRHTIRRKGMRLVAYGYWQGSDRTAVLVHDFEGNYITALGNADFYFRKGYNILAVNCRGCGESAGAFRTLGYEDGKDLAAWAQFLVRRKGQKNIIFDGIGAGAAAVLSASGEETLPREVGLIVADSSFTTIYDLLDWGLARFTSLPSFPILPMSEWFFNHRGHISMIARSPIDSVARSRCPIFLIHGEKDALVPVEMCRRLQESCSSEATTMIVRNAGHGEARMIEEERCFSALEKVIEASEAEKSVIE